MILYNDFKPFVRVEWGAGDTETFTYINGEKVTNEQLIELGSAKKAAFFRQNATVRVWAWQFSDGQHFFVCNEFDEFINFLSEHKVKSVWFYNAKFDFAQIDYQLLTHNPVYVNRDENTRTNMPFTYSSLHNDKGGRFSLKIWTPYKASGTGSRKVDRHKHTHGVTFYDFCNIFGGGLKSVLESFNTVDYDGNPIRKLKMDYQRADEFNLSNDDFNYLKNDTCGLFHAIRIADETLKKLTGYGIAKSKPDIMTAGGLAKKVLLSFLYPDEPEHRGRVRAFQKEHPLTVKQDEFLRRNKLYSGGICMINERYQGRLITGQIMHRYDVNSEYPFIMANMLDLYGHGEKMSNAEYEKKPPKYRREHMRIFIFSEFCGELKTGFVPCFRNPFTGEYEKQFDIDERFLMFENEFDELKNWYNFDNFTENCIVFKARKNPRYSEFVNTFYTLKNETKINGDKVGNKFAKLLLNSSYGKLAEHVKREITERKLNENNAVRLLHTEEYEIEEKNMLSVVQGAYVTASARVWILSHIREICGNVEQNFIYADTDSIHTFCDYPNTDAHAIGAFKNEGEFNAIKYIAPKCYFDGNTDENGKIIEIEFHTKGLSVALIKSEFMTANGDYKPLDEINKRFEYGQKFQPLSGMNIRGGKALIPIEKYLAKPLTGLTWSAGGLYVEP